MDCGKSGEVPLFGLRVPALPGEEPVKIDRRAVIWKTENRSRKEPKGMDTQNNEVRGEYISGTCPEKERRERVNQ